METIENDYSRLVDSLDLNKDDTIFISSDISNLAKYFKSIGENFQVNRFIEELQTKLSNGTIVIPAYTDNLRNNDVFDIQKSKPTTGALSNRIGRRKDFSRTFDPLHSVYVWGKEKDEILNLSDETSFGERSIFGFFAKVNPKFLFIDVDLQNSFTFIHYLEQKRRVHYRKFYPLEIQIKNEEIIAPKLIQFHTKRMGIVTNLYPLQAFLLKNEFFIKKKDFGSRIFISDAETLTNGVAAFLKTRQKLYKFDFVLLVKQLVKRLLGKNYF
jgi:aminoglycoside 3-N-acetyltransferase